jgi:hypothetical protein
MPGHGGRRNGSERKPYNPSSKDIRRMFFRPQHQQEQQVASRRRSEDDVANESQQQNEPMDQSQVGAGDELDATIDTDSRSNNEPDEGCLQNGNPTDQSVEDADEEMDTPLDNPAWSNDTWHDIPLTVLEKSGNGRALSGEVKRQTHSTAKKGRKMESRRRISTDYSSTDLSEVPHFLKQFTRHSLHLLAIPFQVQCIAIVS